MDEIVDQYRKIATSLGLDKKTENAFVLENIYRITKEKRDDEQRVLELERNEKQTALEHERDEKQKVLEFERKEKERERSSQLELEKERLKIEVLEREKAHEASERDRTQQFELEKLRLINEQKSFELEANTSRQESQTSLSETRNPSTRWNIDMPLLNAAAEVDVAAYLKRFEHLCETQNIPREYWTSALSAKFTGNSLRLYDMLSKDEIKDYDLFSQALLKRFLLTAEHFRQSFRTKKIETGETYSQFMSRLSGLFSKWTELSGTSSTYSDLRSLILREQFLQQESPELAIFLKEREFDSLLSLTHAADLFQEAHEKDVKTKPHQEPKKFQQQNASANKGQHFENNTSNKKFVAKGDNQDSQVTCTYCKRRGHLESKCYQKFGRPAFNQRIGAMSNSNSNQDFQLVTETPNQFIPEPSNNRQSEQTRHVFHEHDSSSGCKYSCGPRDINFTCGCSAYNVRSAFEIKTSHQAEKLNPITTGKINGKMGRVLRDTGATCIVVKESFVEKRQFTGGKELCVLIDGTTKLYPTAMIHLVTPYFHGKSKAIVMDNTLYDVFNGSRFDSNVDFKRAASTIQPKESAQQILLEPVGKQIESVEINPSSPVAFEIERYTAPILSQTSLIQEPESSPNPIQEVSNEIQEVNSQTETLEIQAVLTRGMKAKSQQPLKPLKTPTFQDLDLTVDEVKTLQKSDKSLTKLWEKVDKAPSKVLKPYQHSFYVKNGLLYRKFSSPKNMVGNAISQLVVPEKLRNKVMEISHSSILGAHMGCAKTLSRIVT